MISSLFAIVKCDGESCGDAVKIRLHPGQRGQYDHHRLVGDLRSQGWQPSRDGAYCPDCTREAAIRRAREAFHDARRRLSVEIARRLEEGS